MIPAGPESLVPGVRRAVQLVLLTLGPAALVLLLVACPQQEAAAPARNLDRPTDVAFACLRASADGGVEPLPLRCCQQTADGGSPFGVEASAGPGVGEDDGGPECPEVDGGPLPTLVAYVANSARGEIGVVNASARVLVDTDFVRQGFNFVAVGRLPSDIGARPDGTRVYTANFGSCDISVLDTRTSFFAPNVSTLSPELPVGGKRVRSRPQQLVVDGNSDQAWVSFPDCRLVAKVDLVTGAVLRAVYIDPEGMAHDPAKAPPCPARCEVIGGLAVPGSPDGGPETSAPHGLAVAELESRRLLFVGNTLSRWLTVVDADDFSLVERFDLGVATTRVRISPPVAGREGMRYAYAVARDGTIEVIGIAPDGRLQRCETNRSPLAPPLVDDGGVLLPDAGLPGCPPVDPALREALARGPAITLPNRVQARDVAFAEVSGPRDGGVDPVRQLRGTFAYVTASNGNVFAVQIYDSDADGGTGGFAHELRNGTSLDGGMVAISQVTRTGPAGGLTDEQAAVAPYFAVDAGVMAPLDGGVQLHDGALPPPAEQWTITAQGSIPSTVRTTGRFPDQPAQFVDPGADYCAFGVMPGDRLELTGCAADADCPTDHICQTEPGAPIDVPGICVLEGTDPELCRNLVRGRREFLIDTVSAQRLTLLPVAQEELLLGQPVAATLQSCTRDEDCPDGAPRCFVGICAATCATDADCASACQGRGQPPDCARCDPERICVQRCAGGLRCDTEAGYRCVPRIPVRGARVPGTNLTDVGGLECRQVCTRDEDCAQPGYGCVAGHCRFRCRTDQECAAQAPPRTVDVLEPQATEPAPRTIAYACVAGRCMLGCSEARTGPDEDPLDERPVSCTQSERFRCLRIDGPSGREGPACLLTAPLTDEERAGCYPEFTPYRVRVGNGAFLVQGALTGVLNEQVALGSRCGTNPTPENPSNPLRNSRAYLAETFVNPYFSFTLESIDPPERGFALTFNIQGGFTALQQDVGVLPLGLGLGPDRWLYVVDQGDSVAGALGVRGSLVRLDPSSLTIDSTFLIR